MTTIFTQKEIDTMSEEIDRQLTELQKQTGSSMTKGTDKMPDELPLQQRQVIEKITGEKPRSFLKRFTHAAKKDLCEEDGLLYKQWKKWSDLSNEDVLQTFGSVLVGMGIGAGNLQMLAVAVGVIVIHIGVKAVCSEYSEGKEK